MPKINQNLKPPSKHKKLFSMFLIIFSPIFLPQAHTHMGVCPGIIEIIWKFPIVTNSSCFKTQSSFSIFEFFS